MQEGTRHTDALALTAGKCTAQLTHRGIIALGQAVDKAVQRSFFAGCFHLFPGGIPLCNADVVLNGIVEQLGLLRHKAFLFAREQESLVTQETELFDDTIENNIRIAKRDATREEVEAACKKAALDGFIHSLPKGYDTPVGELGGALSGGERQRIGVARAFLHDAPFLLLDEPTSNLDSLNEGVILKAVRAECKDKTVLLVSHRKSTMAAADISFSVESGRLS